MACGAAHHKQWRATLVGGAKSAMTAADLQRLLPSTRRPGTRRTVQVHGSAAEATAFRDGRRSVTRNKVETEERVPLTRQLGEEYAGSPAAMTWLSGLVSGLIATARAPGTDTRKLAAAREFLDFCAFAGWTEMPSKAMLASGFVACGFASWLSFVRRPKRKVKAKNGLLAYSYVMETTSHLSTYLAREGYTAPQAIYGPPERRQTWHLCQDGLKKVLETRKRGKLALMTRLVKRMLRVMRPAHDRGNEWARVLTAAFTLAAFYGLRSCDYSLTSDYPEFQPWRHLQMRDVQFYHGSRRVEHSEIRLYPPNVDTVYVHIKVAKNDQSGIGRNLAHVIVPGDYCVVKTMARYVAWARGKGRKENEPLFFEPEGRPPWAKGKGRKTPKAHRGKGLRGVTVRAAIRLLLTILAATEPWLNLDPKRYSSHSFRKAMITMLASAPYISDHYAAALARFNANMIPVYQNQAHSQVAMASHEIASNVDELLMVTEDRHGEGG